MSSSAHSIDIPTYRTKLQRLLTNNFVPAGFDITKEIEVDPVPENANYEALNLTLNQHRIVFRKAKVTSDRPGAFLAVWQRASSSQDINVLQTNVIAGTDSNKNKPIPLNSEQLDFLFIEVASTAETSDEATPIKRTPAERGMFIFPISLLIAKGIVSSAKHKGKNGFRVFPPWTKSRGDVKTQVFSDSGKKTQRWQLPYFVSIDENGLIDSSQLPALLG